MIDPIHSLAFSIQANRGIYAILLGSGVSRSASIPTGWEITLDLIRKLANLHEEECEPEPDIWFETKFRKPADYSELLDKLAKTQTERQQLLRNYWESNAQEREEGLKQPTAAHRAVASLVAQGFIRVIITTNFDRLMESALVDTGVVPTILSSPDQVHGSLPLIHTRCCIFKVHGDYLDTRIRNTPDELDQYPKEFDRLLDRIFDEFGLVVCGWSTEYDEALRNALMRAPSRRFATYWAVLGEPNDKAEKLIEHRGAQKIRIDSADKFFPAIQQNVESLEEFSRPHPLSTEAAVASLKRYLLEPRYQIKLADLVDDVIDKIIEITSGPVFTENNAQPPDCESFTARIRAYAAACSTLLPMAATGGYWSEMQHLPIWQKALQRLTNMKSSGGSIYWEDLHRYPGTLLLYSLGLGLVANGKLEFLGRLFETTLYKDSYNKDIFAVQRLPASCLIQNGIQHNWLEGVHKRYVQLSLWLFEHLKKGSRQLFSTDSNYELIFDKLETLMALSYVKHANNDEWFPPGRFVFRNRIWEHILNQMEISLSTLGDESPYVQSKLFGETNTICLDRIKAFNKFRDRSPRW